MRSPTPAKELYEFWRLSLMGYRLDVLEDEPQCGWYKTRIAKGGPFVPARVYVHRVVEGGELVSDETVKIEINGYPVPNTRWISLARRPISKAEFDSMGYVENARQPVDLTKEIPTP